MDAIPQTLSGLGLVLCPGAQFAMFPDVKQATKTLGSLRERSLIRGKRIPSPTRK